MGRWMNVRVEGSCMDRLAKCRGKTEEVDRWTDGRRKEDRRAGGSADR